MEAEIIREIRKISLDNDHRFAFIAKYIIENISDMPNLSIKEFAQVTYCSPSTISRFTKYLNLSGYKELTHLLKYFNYNLLEDSQKKQSNHNNVVYEYYCNSMTSIQDTFNLLISQDDIIAEVVIKLNSAKKIIIFAVGVTFNLARDFQQKLLRIGLNAIVVDGVHNGYYVAKLSNEDTFNIFISYSGETQDLIKLALICKENNSPILVISRKDNNSMSKIANLKLVISSNESITRTVSFTSRLALIFCLDFIFYKFLMIDFEHYNAVLDTTSSIFI